MSLFCVFQTTSAQVQSIIESRVEKRTKGVYVPIGSKKLISFIDDLNMPAKDTYGSQVSYSGMHLPGTLMCNSVSGLVSSSFKKDKLTCNIFLSDVKST